MHTGCTSLDIDTAREEAATSLTSSPVTSSRSMRAESGCEADEASEVRNDEFECFIHIAISQPYMIRVGARLGAYDIHMATFPHYVKHT